MMHPKTIGVVAGLIAGIVIAWLGFAKFLVVVLCVLIGWFIAKVYLGEIDLLDTYERFQTGRRRKPLD
jgi:chromate transport protein ChrA